MTSQRVRDDVMVVGPMDGRLARHVAEAAKKAFVVDEAWVVEGSDGTGTLVVAPVSRVTAGWLEGYLFAMGTWYRALTSGQHWAPSPEIAMDLMRDDLFKIRLAMNQLRQNGNKEEALDKIQAVLNPELAEDSMSVSGYGYKVGDRVVMVVGGAEGVVEGFELGETETPIVVMFEGDDGRSCVRPGDVRLKGVGQDEQAG